MTYKLADPGQRDRNRSGPSLLTIARWWATETDELPRAYFRGIGLGEPSCWACGWLPPVDEYADWAHQYPDADHDWLLRQTWKPAGQYLDRAHLKDHTAGGESKPFNIVPLCHFPCHRDMPAFDDRDAALAWVAARPDKHWFYQMMTDGECRDGSLTRRNMPRMYRICLEKIILMDHVRSVSDPEWTCTCSACAKLRADVAEMQAAELAGTVA